MYSITSLLILSARERSLLTGSVVCDKNRLKDNLDKAKPFVKRDCKVAGPERDGRVTEG